MNSFFDNDKFIARTPSPVTFPLASYLKDLERPEDHFILVSCHIALASLATIVNVWASPGTPGHEDSVD